MSTKNIDDAVKAEIAALLNEHKGTHDYDWLASELYQLFVRISVNWYLPTVFSR